MDVSPGQDGQCQLVSIHHLVSPPPTAETGSLPPPGHINPARHANLFHVKRSLKLYFDMILILFQQKKPKAVATNGMAIKQPSEAVLVS